MAKFSQSRFDDCSIPLVFEDHHFILESGSVPRVSVIRIHEGRPIFEVNRNKPMMNPLSEILETDEGVVNVFDKQTGRFLYVLSIGSETNLVLRKIDGGKINIGITENFIQIDGDILHKGVFNSLATTIFLDYHGRLSVEDPRIPAALLELLPQTVSPARQ